MKRSLSDWANIAEIVGAFSIVLSLVFVGLQVRQGAEETSLNTRAIQAGAFQELTVRISALNLLLAENPQLAELWRRALAGEDIERTSVDGVRIATYMFAVFRYGELAFRQFENGLIDEPTLTSMLIPVHLALTSPIGRQAWDFTKLDKDFTAYINDRRSDSER